MLGKPNTLPLLHTTINNLNAYSSSTSSQLLKAKQAVYLCYWSKKQFSLPLGFSLRAINPVQVHLPAARDCRCHEQVALLPRKDRDL